MREQFTDGQIAGFLRRSYFVVDGLWFVKAEQRHGLDEAMELDEAVWEVMSKVQARKARQILAIEDNSLASLARAFQLKLASEGHDYEIEVAEREVRLTVATCPWYEILKASGRTQLSETIAERICAREYAGWAREFSPDISFELVGRLCVEGDGCERCTMVFSRGCGIIELNAG